MKHVDLYLESTDFALSYPHISFLCLEVILSSSKYRVMKVNILYTKYTKNTQYLIHNTLKIIESQ